MMYTLRLIISSIMISIIPSISCAESKDASTEKRYRFSLNNALLPAANSTVGLGKLSLELYRTTIYPIDFMNQHYYSDYKGATTIATLGYGLVHGLFVMLPVSIAYHEFGHARGLIALDSRADPTYHVGLPDLDGVNNPLPFLVSGKTYYHMLWSFMKNATAGFVLPQDATELINAYYTESNKEKIIEAGYQLIDLPKLNQISIWAGGFNNQAILASTIEDQSIHQNGFYAFDILAIFLNKLMPVFYPQDGFFYNANDETQPNYNLKKLIAVMNDHESIKRHYRMKNIIPDYTAEMSKSGCFLSFLLSGSTYQGVYNIYNYVANGQLYTQAFSYHGFYLPNTSFFFTSQGLSLRFKAAYQWNPNLLLIATYERVYKGNRVHECKFSAYKTISELADLRVFGGILISSGTQQSLAVQGNLGVTIPLGNNVNIEAAYYLWNKNTLEGERNIPSAEKSNFDYEIMIGVSAEY